MKFPKMLRTPVFTASVAKTGQKKKLSTNTYFCRNIMRKVIEVIIKVNVLEHKTFFSKYS